MSTARLLDHDERKPALKLRLVPSFDLPLSWAWNATPSEPEQLSFITLPTGAKFVWAARLSPSTDLEGLKAKLAALGERVIVRGCTEALARELGPKGMLTLGSSARLDLETWRAPRNVRQAAKRGQKEVEIRELAQNEETNRVVAPWLKSLRGDGPSLQYLFCTELSQAQRAFAAFAPGSSEPAGLVTMCRYGEAAWHLELLCRDPSAPPGTMEQLLVSVIETLKREGARVLSLGEVGLDFAAKAPRLSWLNRVIRAVAPLFVRLVRGRYDVAGLHRFKDKFDPAWEPRYFVATGELKVKDLYALTVASRIRELM